MEAMRSVAERSKSFTEKYHIFDCYDAKWEVSIKVEIPDLMLSRLMNEREAHDIVENFAKTLLLRLTSKAPIQTEDK